ncbi:MAG: hypothetical protein WC437_04815 [Patescibacteria group bacterium]
MGTRNLTVVICDSQVKIAQYGQWDGYLDGAGRSIAAFFEKTIANKPVNMKKFMVRVRRCKFIDEAKLEEINTNFGAHNGMISLDNSNRLKEQYPTYDRGMGCDVLEYVYDHKDKEIWLLNSYSFGEESLFCEYAYVIDLDRGIIEIYRGFNKRPMKKTDRWYSETPDGEYYGVTLWQTIPLKEFTDAKIDELVAMESSEDDE